jgi:hypothetical protein
VRPASVLAGAGASIWHATGAGGGQTAVADGEESGSGLVTQPEGIR